MHAKDSAGGRIRRSGVILLFTWRFFVIYARFGCVKPLVCSDDSKAAQKSQLSQA